MLNTSRLWSYLLSQPALNQSLGSQTLEFLLLRWHYFYVLSLSLTTFVASADKSPSNQVAIIRVNND